MRKTNSKGFTIIELLVVIVIIGILVALALPQLFAAQARGRDTDRKNDLKNVKTQLETYFNDKGFYPTNSGSSAEGATVTPVTDVNITTVITGDLQEELSLTDDDLIGPRDDAYLYTSDGNTYTLQATLENKSDTAATDENGTYIVESVNQDTDTDD
jgi:type II secretion system protein G